MRVTYVIAPRRYGSHMTICVHIEYVIPTRAFRQQGGAIRTNSGCFASTKSVAWLMYACTHEYSRKVSRRLRKNVRVPVTGLECYLRNPLHC
jgi:hypothetical protein